jgi:hypothetical protein
MKRPKRKARSKPKASQIYLNEMRCALILARLDAIGFALSGDNYSTKVAGHLKAYLENWKAL